MEEALSHNRRKEMLTLDFREDIYKKLFKDKGHKFGWWQVLEKEDFLLQYFPDRWDVNLNEHGEGMKLHYPVKIRCFISWSPPKFESINGETVQCKRAPFEKLSIQVKKVSA